MKPELNKHIIIKKEEKYLFIEKYSVLDIIDLKNGKELISYIDKPNNQEDEENFDSY
jgi:hypothetical protein